MKMSSLQRWLVWTSSILTFFTGVAYWWMKNGMEPVDAWAVINHPLQPWMLKAHILVAPVAVFAVGFVAGEHVWKGWRQGVRQGRRSGMMAMWVFVPMVFSGYLIQAVTHVGWLEALAWLHLGTGTIYGLGLLAHHTGVRQRLARWTAARERTERTAYRVLSPHEPTD